MYVDTPLVKFLIRSNFLNIYIFQNFREFCIFLLKLNLLKMIYLNLKVFKNKIK